MQTQQAKTQQSVFFSEQNLMSNDLTIESRYGTLSVNLDNAIFLPKGLLGMPDFKDFALVDLPNPKMAHLKLLQSLNDKDLSFVVLPLSSENNFIESDDVEECINVTEISKDNMLMLVILTVQNIPGNVKITANIRAPIVIDTAEKLAVQYVFPNSKYDIRHILS